MSSRCIERAIDTGDGTVCVRRDGGLTIRWYCGDERHFAPAELALVIDDLELLADYDDVWLEVFDSHGRRCWAQVAEGELWANDHTAKGNSVPWKTLKKTLAKMS